MHANAGNHLHGGITDNIVWQGWWRDLAVMPSHCYDDPSGKVGLQFVGDLKSELCGVRGRRWNSERFIVFQKVILQRDFHVTASHTIRRRIKKTRKAWAHTGGMGKDRSKNNPPPPSMKTGKAGRRGGIDTQP